MPAPIRNPRPPLPGVYPPGEADVATMIRVDHAGEMGALCIYEGQLAMLKRTPAAGPNSGAEAIQRMAEQERGHFDAFDHMVKERGVRPTALEPIWRIAGYALGAATALMCEKAAMACTVAVEEVIDGHYAKQIERLGESDPQLSGAIKQFRADERAHRDEALERGAEEAPAYKLLSAAIGLSCRLAIGLSERL